MSFGFDNLKHVYRKIIHQYIPKYIACQSMIWSYTLFCITSMYDWIYYYHDFSTTMKKQISWKFKAFTLVELLIVIVIISILVAVLLPRLVWFQNRAKVRSANIQMRDFNIAIIAARISDFRALKNVTQNDCSDCVCREIGDLRKLPANHQCRLNRLAVLQKITAAAGLRSGALASLQIDPRWSPYQLDENEGEFTSWDCRTDTFFSVWPNWLRESDFAPAQASQSRVWWRRLWSDDIPLDSAPAFCPGAY